jgi:glycosyltransferase involved in cell wall biosynthesis/O-antigen/teichoic acid export membrane protein
MFIGGFALMAGLNIANVLNLLFNGYLGRVLDYNEFASITLATSINSLISIPMIALSSTVNHQVNYLIGKYGERNGLRFWKKTLLMTIKGSILVSILWIAAIPFLMSYFRIPESLYFLIFLPILSFAFITAINKGFLYGNLMFGTIGFVSLMEPLTKLLAAFILVNIGKPQYAYAAIPIGLTVAFCFGWIFIFKKVKSNIKIKPERKGSYPYKFLFVSVLVGLSSISFLSMDVLLAKHFLTPTEAGEYSLLSLVGKMIYFLGSLTSPFLLPLVSRNEGANKNSQKVFSYTLLGTAAITFLGYIAFGVFGAITVPLLFGAKTHAITQYLPTFCFAFILFSLSQVIVTYYQAKKIYIFPLIAFILSFVQLILFQLFHETLGSFVWVMILGGFINLFVMYVFHLQITYVKVLENNIRDFLDIFSSKPLTSEKPATALSILVFNWRDTKHKWAGGAEVYIQELAKRWVAQGHKVTIFSGSDGQSARYEKIDGVEIIRRGGFYSVYIWAFLYYMLKLKDKYDIILDSENGVPFFTPLYAKQKVYLLIHHVHQEVFRQSLTPPLSLLAQFLELKVMPFVYRHTQTLTVSPSSKDEIMKHKLTKEEPLIIYNGVDLKKFVPKEKNEKPLILYLGRLQYYKSLPVFIKAAKKILENTPNAEFIIAGEGGQKKRLQKLTSDLGIDSKITFTGKVTEEQKIDLLQRAWVFVNPSMMEGWGITTIEANACGTPTVASNVPGLKDSIKDKQTGFLVKYNSDGEFAQKIIELINNKELREDLSRNAIEWAKDYDWDKSAQRSMNLFEREVKFNINNDMLRFAQKI